MSTVRALGGLVVALAVLVVGIVACGGGDGGERVATPGFDGTGTSLDDAPFELAMPDDTGGPTTIGSTLPLPFGVTTAPPPQPTTTTLPETTTTTTPTTTTTKPEFYLPLAEDITGICGMWRSVMSIFPKDGGITDAEIRRIFDRLLPNLEVYARVAPASALEAVEVVTISLTRLADLFTEGGDDQTYPPLVDELVRLQQELPPFERLADSLEAVRLIEIAEGCPPPS